jgi:hypothetical protein
MDHSSRAYVVIFTTASVRLFDTMLNAGQQRRPLSPRSPLAFQMIALHPAQRCRLADLPIDTERIRALRGVDEPVHHVHRLRILAHRRRHRQHMILPAVFARV